ncbi:helix-turn-helix domain-containing protein [uncultured Flavonifractor sp.]|uniref:helix-turn-helix domain-containing protein n=1 Tax=uncultured Flavonifractor sp. TaxID=1193534 RepID=UPI002628F809|nr:helix-turn-helix transcriptional regulator [uncultured Flavonifractor sp.]
MRDIGKNIRTLRERRGMTQEELAQALFVTRQTVSNYETGKSRPDIDMLVSIAQVLESDVNQVLYGLPPEQDRQREVRYLAVGCLIVAAIFLVLTLPAPLMNKIIQRRYVGADLVMALTCLMKPAIWLLSGWCALQGLGLLRVARPLEERVWITWARRGVLLFLVVNVVLFLPLLVVGLIQVIQDGLGLPYEALAEVPQIQVYAWLANRLLMLNVLYPQVYTVLGVALWLFRFPKR